MKRLQKIDELSLPNHCNICEDDECYFIISYTSGKGYNYNHENSLISNLKKGMDKKGKPEWGYKIKAIKECARYLKEVDIPSAFSKNITLVPIPPSKAKSDPEYDDRLSQVLHEAFGDELDIRELIIQKESTQSSHTSDEKRDPKKIAQNYEINEVEAKEVKNCIILFDDVLTTGAHFKVAKSVLLESFPNCKIKGLFIARRIYEQMYDFDLLSLTLKPE